VPKVLDRLGYMRTVVRGSPVDEPWSLRGMLFSRIREGMSPKDSPLTLEDVMTSPDYRDLMTPAVDEGDLAPDFELQRVEGDGTVRLSALSAERPVALVFGSYT
jgi:hypothetical protein